MTKKDHKLPLWKDISHSPLMPSLENLLTWLQGISAATLALSLSQRVLARLLSLKQYDAG